MNAMGNKTIVKTRVTYVFNGYGDLTLTDVALVWNKSATSYLMFGAMGAMTSNHIMIPLEDIASVSKYTYFPGGGLLITTKTGEEHKFSFKHKKDFKIVYEYLTK
jgi:hypothetical protein